jgi:hypothetical protein
MKPTCFVATRTSFQLADLVMEPGLLVACGRIYSERLLKVGAIIGGTKCDSPVIPAKPYLFSPADVRRRGPKHLRACDLP